MEKSEIISIYKKGGASGIPIRRDDGSEIGELKAVDNRMAEEEEVLRLLTSWRQKFMRYFLTQFKATIARTSTWLEEIVLKEDSRILFLILDEKGRPIGNFGVCNINEKSAELDNLIRGEKGGDVRLVYFSELALINWLFCSFDLDNIYLHIFSNNRRTLSLHETVGFKTEEVYRITKKISDERVEYVVDREKGPLSDEPALVKMSISRKSFFARYNWLEG